MERLARFKQEARATSTLNHPVERLEGTTSSDIVAGILEREPQPGTQYLKQKGLP